MAATSACPNPERWQIIAQGQLSDAEFEPLLAHVEDCPACSQQVRQLPRDETIEGPLGQNTVTDEPVSEIVARLMDRLKKLPVVRLTNDVTVRAQELSATIAPQAETRDEITQEVYGFLDLAQGPDELGRLGGYRVLKLLGSGGMGAVFLAEDVNLQRQVALKVMRPGVAANPQAHDRFLREARACAALKHDNIVTIYQVGEERGVPFLAMEFLQGMPLDVLLDSNRKLTVAQILRIAREIARGLAAAHEKGLIHRDIKPANIWLDRQSGRVKILDFGLARTSTENVNLTQSGTIVGTPAYMAPEQARGEKVDGRTDLFSLGAVLYRICAGQNPFGGANMMAVLTSLALDTPKPVGQCNREIPPALASLIERLMAKDPTGRPESARAVVAEIQAIERSLGTPTLAPTPVPEARPVPKPAPRHVRGWVPALVAAAILGVVSVVLALTVFRVDTEKGTLVVEIDDPSVQVVLRQNGVVVQDGTTKREFTLKAGEGELVVTDRDGVTLTTKTFTIKRADREVVSVKLEGRAEVKPEPIPNPMFPVGKSAFNALHRDQIDPEELIVAGGGNANSAPRQLVGVIGSTRFNQHHGVLDLAFRPDGKQLATINKSRGGLYLWNPTTGRQTSKLEIAKTLFTALQYSPDNKALALGDKQHTVRLVHPESQEILRTLKGHTGEITALRFSTDGKRLYSGSGLKEKTVPGEIIAWNVESGEKLWVVSVDPDGVADLTLSVDGKQLIVLCGSEIRLFNPQDGKEVRKITNHELRGKQLAINSATGQLAVRRGSYQVQFLNLETDKESGKLSGGFSFIKYSADGKWLAVAEARATKLYDDNRRFVREIPKAAGAPDAMDFSPDGATLAVTYRTGGVVLYDVASGEQRWAETRHVGSLRSLSLSGDGSALLTVGDDDSARIWDIATGKMLQKINTWPVRNAVFFPTGKLIVVATDTEVSIWDGTTGVEKWKTARANQARPMAVSPDGSRILLTQKGKGLVVVEATSGKELLLTKPNAMDVSGQVAWSPDGKWIAGTYHLPIDSTSGQSPFPQVSDETCYAIAFSPDGRIFYRVTRKEIERWDLTTFQQLKGLSSKEIDLTVVTSDSARLISLTSSSKLVVRDAVTGVTRQIIEMPRDCFLNSLAVAPDGRHAIVGNISGAVYIYRLEDAPSPDKTEP